MKMLRRLLCLLAVVITLATEATCAEEMRHLAEQVLGKKDHTVYIISNLPNDQARARVCRDAPSLHQNCRDVFSRIKYFTLDDLGKCGKSGTDLLPYDPVKKAQTVVVLNTDRLPEEHLAKVERLQRELAPTVSLPPGAEAYWIYQNLQDNCYAIICVAPTEGLLVPLLDEAWQVPKPQNQTVPHENYLTTNSRMHYARAFAVERTRVLTNDPAAEQVASQVYNREFTPAPLSCGGLNPAPRPLQIYQVYSLDEEGARQFASTGVCSLRLTMVNWNSEKEIKQELVAPLLPEGCQSDRPAMDARNLSPWQQFCREVTIANTDAETRQTFVAAPTSRHLALAAKACLAGGAPATGSETAAPTLADLSVARRVAVGPYFVDKATPRDRVYIQQKLEEITRAGLPLEVCSTQDLGQLLADVLGTEAQTPFGAPEDVTRVVTATNADFLLVLWVQNLTPSKTFSHRERRLTPPLPQFNEAEPQAPNPNQKRPFSSHYIYPGNNETERRNSPKFRDDWARYQDARDAWEQSSRDYQQQVTARDVQWECSIHSQARCQFTGELNLIDLATRKVVWSCSLTREGSGTEERVRDVALTSRGENSSPQLPAMPADELGWQDPIYPVAQNALELELANGLERLKLAAAFAKDIKEWNRGLPLPEFGTKWFVLKRVDGGELRCQIAQPLAIVDDQGQSRDLDSEKLLELMPEAEGLRGVRLTDGSQFSAKLKGASFWIRSGQGQQMLPVSDVKSVGVPPPPPVTSRQYVLATEAGSVTGPLVLGELDIDTAVGKMPMKLELVESIARNDDGAYTVVMPGQTLTGSILGAALVIRLGEEDRTVEWGEVRELRLYTPPPPRQLQMTRGDGSKVTVAFANPTLRLTVLDKTLELPTHNIAELSVEQGVVTVVVQDNRLQGRPTADSVNLLVDGKPEPEAVPWSAVARLTTPPTKRVTEPEKHVVRQGRLVRKSGTVFLTLRDAMEFAGAGAAQVTVPAKGQFIIKLNQGVVRVKDGDPAVHLGEVEIRLEAAPFVQDKPYVPAGFLERIFGYPTSVDDGVIYCTKDDVRYYFTER